MQLASYILSLCLHVAAFLLIWFWPAPSPLKLDAQPIFISLVEGAPGGNMAPSPILGHVGEESSAPKAPSAPAPQSEIAKPANDIKEPEPVKSPEIPKDPVKIKEPEPVKEPEKPIPVPEPPKEEVKKEEPKKEEPKKEEPKPEPKKEEPKKEPKVEKPKPKPQQPKPKRDPVAEALAQARKKASSTAQSGDKGNAIEQALAQAKKKASGTGGGGGGQGDGPGGGGLGDVYMGQVMLAVRPNWGYATASRNNMSCVIKVRVDMDGKVLSTEVIQGSGNAQFDASAVNAIVRTNNAGQYPPPPSSEYMEMDLVFTLDELMGR